MDFFDVMRSRISIRKYKDAPVPKEKIDALIERHSNGWKPSRISPVSRSAVRLCIYEMLYMKDIPTAVSMNEAIELVKKFDDVKMRAFVNGLLNGVKDEIEAARKA